MKILHIIASPRGKESRTLRISEHLLGLISKKYPGTEIDNLDLFREELPALGLQRVNGKYELMSGMDLSENTKDSWARIIEHIERFKSADTYVISSPMWNFGIPWVLKTYLDVIVQPRFLFKYTESGPVGLAKGKVYIVSTRGGDYSEGSPYHSYDQMVPYLKTVLGFIGFKDISFISAQPMDALGAETRERKLQEAIQSLDTLDI